jgi:hypothetical protein
MAHRAEGRTAEWDGERIEDTEPSRIVGTRRLAEVVGETADPPPVVFEAEWR